MEEDIVRVLRIVEYVGPRSVVEDQVDKSMNEPRRVHGMTIRAATIGRYPELLEQVVSEEPEEEVSE